MIIDIHAHLWGSAYQNNKKTILRACELFDFSRVYISSISSYYPSPDDIRGLNALTLDFMKENTGLIRGFVYVDPRHGNKLDVLEKGIGSGMEGVKMWVSLKCDDERVFPVAEKCIELNVPLLLHAWAKTTGQLENESTAENIRNLALRYPKLKLLMAHMGGNVYHGMRCIADLQNVWTDFSGTPVGRGDLAYAVAQLGDDRILFGTDMPAGGRQCIAKVEEAGLSEEQKQKIYYKNALRLLGEDDGD